MTGRGWRWCAAALAAGALAARVEAADRLPTAAEQGAAQAIAAPALRAHVKFLASDLLEGRLPGTRGGRLAEAYVASQLEALGLEPGAPSPEPPPQSRPPPPPAPAPATPPPPGCA